MAGLLWPRSGGAPRMVGQLWPRAPGGGGGSEPSGGSEPDEIPNLALWLAADSLTLDPDAAVSTWPDLSGNGGDATQATSGKRPIYRESQGFPTVEFVQASAHRLTLAAGLFRNVSGADIFAVMARPASGGTGTSNTQEVIFATQSSGEPFGASRRRLSLTVRHNIGDYFAAFTPDGTTTVYSANGGTIAQNPTIIEGAYDLAGNQVAISRDGALLDTSPLGGSTATPDTDSATVMLGGQGPDTTSPLTGHIAEVAVYRRVLDSDEREALLTYLSTKYDITLA